MDQSNTSAERHLFRLSGKDARSFLQGLVTNDVERIDEGLVYAALLTPQGKYLADFFLLRDPEDTQAVLLDVAQSLAEGLRGRLTMYKLRADVTISDSALHVRRGTSVPAPEGALSDPRHAALGWRLYGGQEETQASDDGSDWTAIRVAHCIPETGIELTPDSYILEAGFETLRGVDFRKGCYVGQEVTARMKHKTELRKGLTRVAIAGEASPGTEITRAGKPVGTLLSRTQTEAIAYMRFDRMGENMEAGAARITALD